MPPNVIGVQDAKLDNPAGLEEENGNRAQSEDNDAQLNGDDVPGLKEDEEGDGRNHEEKGDDVVGEGEAP